MQASPWPWHRHPLLVLLTLAALVAMGRAAEAASARAVFSFGTFNKPSSAGSQTVSHGLPSSTTPKAIIFWTSGKSFEAFSDDYMFSFGITDGTTSRSIGIGSDDGSSTANSSRRRTTGVVTMIDGSAAIQGAATFTSWNTTSFTVNWGTADIYAYRVHFLAIGGTDVEAKVTEWQMPVATGNKTISNIGFQPDVVLHMTAGVGWTTAASASTNDAAFSLGTMDASGDQWALAVKSLDGADPTDSVRAQTTAATIYNVVQNGTTAATASFVSVSTASSGSFTVNFSKVTDASWVYSLALRGVNVKAGAFNKDTDGTGGQAVTGVSFTPAALLLASFMSPTTSSVIDHARFGLGGTNGTTEASTWAGETSGAATSSVTGRYSTAKVFATANADAPTAAAAEADLSSFGSDGFNLNWTTNDAVATQILYLAVGPLSASAVELEPPSVRTRGTGVEIAWRTRQEIEHLGFYVHREAGGRTAPVTKELLPGSFLRTGGVGLLSGRSYQVIDPTPRAGTRYWLEEVALSGPSTWHGPYGPAAGAGTGESAASLALATLSTPASRVRRYPAAAAGLQTWAPVDSYESRAAQWRLAAAPAALKIGVVEPGWHRITGAALRASGLSSIDPRNLHLYAFGREHALLVTGEQDGRLDDEDAIAFFGRASGSSATDAIVYWLVPEAGPGLRVLPSGGPAAESPSRPPGVGFPFVVERRDQSLYAAALKAVPDKFLGPIVTTAPVSITLPVDAIAAGDQDVGLEVTAVGLTADEHELRGTFNGSPLLPAAFVGSASTTLRFQLPAAALREGDNVLVVQTGGENDRIVIDAVRLMYRRAHLAERIPQTGATDARNDELLFPSDANDLLIARGFGTSALKLLDVTDPLKPVELPVTVRAGQGETFEAPVAPSLDHSRLLLLAAKDAGRTPSTVIANSSSALHGERAGARMLIIGPRELLARSGALQARRRGEGWTVMAIDTEDIFDEFGYGAPEPRALKAFLAHARERWTVPPTHVLLLGDATFDARNRLGRAQGETVPTALVPTSYIESASDDWFTDFDEDGRADLAIGRLPARSVAELDVMLAKTLAHRPAEGRAHALFVWSGASRPYDFGAAASRASQALPDWATSTVVGQGSTDPLDKSAFMTALAEAPDLVTYMGHASTESWDRNLLTSAEARTLSGTSGRSVFLLMTCLNGFFHDVYTESLAESLLRAPAGGGVAVWASSTLTPPAAQQAMLVAFQEQTLVRGATLGEAARAAKAATDDEDARSSWILFGDPTLRLAPSPGPSTVDAGAPEQADAAAPREPADSAAPREPDSAVDPRATDVRPSEGVDRPSAAGCACQVAGHDRTVPAGPILVGLGAAIALQRVRRRRRGGSPS